MATENDLRLEGLSDAERRQEIKKLSYEEVLRILLEDFCRKTIKTIRQMTFDDEEFVQHMRLTKQPTEEKKPPITTPKNPAWTVELIERLKKYIDAGRYFVVNFNESRVFGMDLVPEKYADKYPPDSAEFFLQEYDDVRPSGYTLTECDPSDFHVFLLKPVEWRMENPNWNEADPEAWAEFQQFQEDSQ